MLAELYVLNGRDVGKVLDASAGPVILMGRAASNTLRVRDPQASRVHCRIDVTTEGLTLRDAQSGNGTFVNEERLEGPRKLLDGDTISLGETRIRVLIETEEDRELYQERLGKARGKDASASGSLEASTLEHSASESVSAAAPNLDSEIGKSKLREVIPGYRLEARLGGHSRQGIAVYRATQYSLERSVALKVFLPRGQTRSEDVERFMREARSVARLPHPHIVTIHDVIGQGKMRAIVMEFLVGGSLRDQLDDGPLSLKQSLRFATMVSNALAYLHEHGVVHRGVKPSNLLFARAHRSWKLANFASATGLQGQRYGDTNFIDSPMEGFSYLAPEQLGADTTRISPATDVYSLGASLLAALIGRPPFEGSSVPTLAAQIMRDPPPEAPDGIPAPLKDVIRRCLAKEPAERFPHGGALLRALQACRASAAHKLPGKASERGA